MTRQGDAPQRVQDHCLLLGATLTRQRDKDALQCVPLFEKEHPLTTFAPQNPHPHVCLNANLDPRPST